MSGVLLVCMLALCLLQTLDNNMVARAGRVTKIRKLKDGYDEFTWCCIMKGCPYSYYFHQRGIYCEAHYIGKTVSCKCEFGDPLGY